MFRTAIKPTNFDVNIDYNSKIMMLGSCFTENIGEVLYNHKFNVDINPFGILYNPISVKKSLEILLLKEIFTKEKLIKHNDQWHSFFHHSKFSDINSNKVLENINTRINKSSIFLENANTLFITFGTSWVYEYKQTNETVSNCHKLPARQFNRRLLNADEITVEYFQILNNIQNANPNLKIIFTISPIRHFKDGFSENNLSKSILKIAIHQILEQFPNTYYFPAYEIMLDDLRDYRFYEADMLHPNNTAINYIFNYFKESFFNEDTKDTILEVKKILKAQNHRPFNKESESYKKFIEANIEKIKIISNNNHEIDFSKELMNYKSLMI